MGYPVCRLGFVFTLLPSVLSSLSQLPSIVPRQTRVRLQLNPNYHQPHRSPPFTISQEYLPPYRSSL